MQKHRREDRLRQLQERGGIVTSEDAAHPSGYEAIDVDQILDALAEAELDEEHQGIDRQE